MYYIIQLNSYQTPIVDKETVPNIVVEIIVY